jgi:hypothetical protein
MVRRSLSVIDAQPAISSRVRPQPMHSPNSVSSKQTLTQGVSKTGDHSYSLANVSTVARLRQKPSGW